ncbi:unnamed protein product [Amaranthus hypochondriacus]
MTINVIGFAYSGLQGLDLLHQLTTKKNRVGTRVRYSFDFAVDHIIVFLGDDEVEVVARPNEADAEVTTKTQRPFFPFAAIVGQDEMKLCLLLNVIDPKIGGMMIMGDRGTGIK